MHIRGTDDRSFEAIETFVEDSLLREEHHGYRQSIRLEEKPTVLAESMGRLLDLLLQKKLINKKELFDVLGRYDEEYFTLE